MSSLDTWSPIADIDTLRCRSVLYQQIRDFMQKHDILEVDTPILNHYGTTEPYIESFSTTSQRGNRYYLHTSPEFCMKRLLAAGVDSIYQITHVFRDEEVGKIHSSEFIMLEWYRVGFNYYQLMDDLGYLMNEIGLPSPDKKTYTAAFLETINIEPHTVTIQTLRQIARDNGWCTDSEDRHELLDFVFSTVVLSSLNTEKPLIIYDYPVCMAALSSLKSSDPVVSERFELFINGMEIANGFNELTDATEQRARFQHDLAKREQSDKAVVAMDEYFLAALEAGLPACAGVALGLDRLLMVLTKKECIRKVNAFTLDKHG